MHFLVTGSAGFIGFHLARRLLQDGHEVTGIDGFTPYYDLRLKERRNEILVGHNGFKAERLMLEDVEALERVWSQRAVDVVVHLAAQAGVRYSLKNPRAYIDANLVGTFNVMEMVRLYPVRHFMLASTSSVYGANDKSPSVETDRTDHPLTLYAATKKSTELMAHCYSHLFGAPTTAFRFFSVYGPWGRPDMAFFKFTKGIIEGVPIDVFNYGEMERDFTYVDDLVEAIVRLAEAPPRAPMDASLSDADDSLSPAAPFRVVNIGGGAPSGLMEFIGEIERKVGHKAIRNYMPMQPGDVPRTSASSDLLQRLIGYKPGTTIEAGVSAFVDWYVGYHREA